MRSQGSTTLTLPDVARVGPPRPLMRVVVRRLASGGPRVARVGTTRTCLTAPVISPPLGQP
ncbi:hypothetical protein KPB2_5520 [Klebsiella pneumoniae Kb677]|nr:hypothetical protein KPB2_5520 [Klebsiella pneumoniae Kb677]